MKRVRRMSMILVVIFVLLVLMSAVGSAEPGKRVISVAGDLNLEQKQDILEHFGITEDEEGITFLQVNIHEEYEYLGDIAGPEIIGNKTMSSAYLELLPEGEGIQVETHNITWVTKEMYASALITAGITDVKISAAAPFPVSGTGALTGVVKAFEEATGEPLTEENKQVAHEELLILSQLAEEIDGDQMNQLIQRAKEEVLSNRPLDYDEIEQLVRELASELNLELTQQQITQITRLLEKFNYLEVDIDQLRERISDFINDPATKPFLARLFEQIIDLLRDIIKTVRS